MTELFIGNIMITSSTNAEITPAVVRNAKLLSLLTYAMRLCNSIEQHIATNTPLGEASEIDSAWCDFLAFLREYGQENLVADIHALSKDLGIKFQIRILSPEAHA